jgi:hypothetical protein
LLEDRCQRALFCSGYTPLFEKSLAVNRRLITTLTVELAAELTHHLSKILLGDSAPDQVRGSPF